MWSGYFFAFRPDSRAVSAIIVIETMYAISIRPPPFEKGGGATVRQVPFSVLPFAPDYSGFFIINPQQNGFHFGGLISRKCFGCLLKKGEKHAQPEQRNSPCDSFAWCDVNECERSSHAVQHLCEAEFRCGAIYTILRGFTML